MEDSPEYLAHIREKDTTGQPLLDHLIKVSRKCGEFASKVKLKEQGELIGLLHDIGKYSDAFQRYLRSAGGILNSDEGDFIDARRMKGKIDHSTAGAQHVYLHYDPRGDKARLAAQALSLCISSHHSGLLDCLRPDNTDGFSARMKKGSDKSFYDEVIMKLHEKVKSRLEGLLSSPDTVDSLIQKMKDVHDPEEKSRTTTCFKQGMLIRFLLSCLLDADRLDTAEFEDPLLSELRNTGNFALWDQLISRLDARLQEFKQSTKIDVLRGQISERCYQFAKKPSGIYLLTVPTGGGKTLASLRFALHHAKNNGMERIVYVIPYTSIIDQNAGEVRRILEVRDTDSKYSDRIVLEHHSNLTPDKETARQMILSQNWDSPIVFTTSVKVLEALFGSGTRDARRMHQLARSVIILDEVQTLPLRCVHMFNNAINFLTKTCGATVVLCTATQPLLDRVNKERGALSLLPEAEIMPDLGKLFADLNRVTVLDETKPGGWTSDEIADLAVNELQQSGSVLLVVNTRKAALVLYEQCKQRKPQAEIFHLSTKMCPAHRSKVLERIHSHLNPEKSSPILCISTQLIEAGVDIDFGSVIRSIAGLDSIAQAAGRCNRHGTRPTGRMLIVNPDFENLDKLEDIKIGKEKAERVLDDFKKDPDYFKNNLLGPKAIERYFQYYFFARGHEMSYPVRKSTIIGRNDALLSLLSTNNEAVSEYKRANKKAPEIHFRQSFTSASKIFEAIDSGAQGIIVQYEEGRSIVAELCATEDIRQRVALLHAAQRYSVNLFSTEWEILSKGHIIHETTRGSGIFYLDEKYYSCDFGLSVNPVTDLPFISA